MKLKIAIFLLSSLCLFVTFPQAQQPAAGESSQESLIKGIERGGGGAGVAYTGRAIFVTGDNGATWRLAELPLGLMENVAGLYVSAKGPMIAVVANNSESTLSLAASNDGGTSWTRTAINLPAADMTEADLSDIGIDVSQGTLRLNIRLVSSSNFDRRAIYTSGDEGSTWTLVSSRSDLKSEDNEGLREASLTRIKEAAGLPADENVVESRVANGTSWLLTQTGTCFGQKTGCVQETRVRLGDGTDITPEAVKSLAAAERENARAAALASPVFALPPGGTTRISLNRGFDKCTAGSSAQLQTWWNASPYYDVNIYMSGRNRACPNQPFNGNPAWLDQVTAQGWGLIPTIVGYQSPCTLSTTTVKLSYDPVASEQQGRGEADIAVTDANAIGLTAGSVLYYDMERYDPPNPDTLGCRVATVAFLKGWTERVHELGFISGVYGSPKNAQEDWMNMPAQSKMDVVWLANWDNRVTVWAFNSFPSFPTSVWTNHQRIKQYFNGTETWGGLTFNIDRDISDAPVAGIAVPKNKNADFDGDGKSDVSIFRPDIGAWYAMYSSNSTVTGLIFGLPTDTPAPGDFDGDGKTDYAVFRPADGSWHWLSKSGIYTSKFFGTSGDVPVPADYNGDGKTDYAVYRPSTGTWYIANSDSLNTITYVQFGQAGDKPATGDYDGDGKADIAIFRPAGATGSEWWILKSSGGVVATQFGEPTDQAVPLDYTGDGKADVAFWRPSTGEWFILRSEDFSYFAFPFGTVGDVPAPGDFDGDGKADASVFRPSNAVWYLLRSQAGFTAVQFGLSNDRPVENAYLPQ